MPQLDRILCIEDDPDIRTIACFSLEKIGGFTVTTAESGEAAMTKIPRFNPQLILLDVMMPGMDGPETLRPVRLCRHACGLHDCQGTALGSGAVC